MLDYRSYHSLKGDGAANTYAPTSPIVIGGAGLSLDNDAGVGNGTSAITGGVSTQSGGRLRYGANDYAQFPIASISRTMLMPIAGLAQQLSTSDGSLTGLSALKFSNAPYLGALNAIAGAAVPFPVIVPIPSRYLHQGAQLISATLNGRVSALPARIGTKILSANIFAVNVSGVVTASLAPYGGTPKLPVQWVSGGTPTLGQYVYPKVVTSGTHTSGQTGLYYVCTQAGTNSAGPVTWPTVFPGNAYTPSGASQVTDGTTVWTAAGLATLPIPATFTGQGYYQNGAGQQISLTPWQPRAWAALATIALGDILQGTAATGQVYMYLCTTATGGITGGGPHPTWPTALGSTVSDASLVWTNIGPIGMQIAEQTNSYFLQIQPDDCGTPWLWTSVLLSYGSITDTRFE